MRSSTALVAIEKKEKRSGALLSILHQQQALSYGMDIGAVDLIFVRSRLYIAIGT
jgi:hypothetical protein